MSNDKLVGYYFVTYDWDGEREYQGQIQGALENGFYLVQIYSWMTGSETRMKIFSTDKLTRAVLFKNSEDFTDYVEATNK